MEITTKYGVYLLVNNINGKIYVGKSVNLKERILAHKNSKKSVIGRAIRKYGWENFTLTILDAFDEIDNAVLLDKEAEWIQKLDSTNQLIGYNLCKRGADRTGVKHTPETIERLKVIQKRAARSGEAHHRFGKKHTAESLRKMSEARIKLGHRGDKSPNFGKKHSQEWINKAKLTIALGSHDHLKRRVKQIDKKTGEVIKVWDSLAAAARGMNGNYNYICQVCRGYVKKNGARSLSAYGFKWAYEENMLTPTPNSANLKA